MSQPYDGNGEVFQFSRCHDPGGGVGRRSMFVPLFVPFVFGRPFLFQQLLDLLRHFSRLLFGSQDEVAKFGDGEGGGGGGSGGGGGGGGGGGHF